MIKLKDLLIEKTIRMGNVDINVLDKNRIQLLGNKGRLGLEKIDAKMIMSAVRKEWSIYENLVSLDEKTIKTKNNVKVELTTKSGYELLRIYGHRGYVDFYGRDKITQFMKILKKIFRIV